MAEIHFLNVSGGDAILIKHESGRLTIMDICRGNIERSPERAALFVGPVCVSPDDGMEQYPTNPLHYLERYFPGERPFRFILSHPDMDHLDGFAELLYEASPINYWDSGVRRTKPDFGNFGAFNERDWDAYADVIAGRNSGITVVYPKAGSRFQFANRGEAESSTGDALYVLAPTPALVAAATSNEDVNDASYVLQYESVGGLVVLPGDAHDATWEYVTRTAGSELAGTSVLIAPHHGRRSNRVCDFLDVLRPQLTLFGCAPEKDMMYNECVKRNLAYLTNGTAGNIVLEAVQGTINVYVQNELLAQALGSDLSIRNRQGYPFVLGLADLRRR